MAQEVDSLALGTASYSGPMECASNYRVAGRVARQRDERGYGSNEYPGSIRVRTLIKQVRG